MTDKPQKNKKFKKGETPQPPAQVAFNIKDLTPEYDKEFQKFSTTDWNYRSESPRFEQWFWNHIRTMTLRTMHLPTNPPLQRAWNGCFG